MFCIIAGLSFTSVLQLRNYEIKAYFKKTFKG